LFISRGLVKVRLGSVFILQDRGDSSMSKFGMEKKEERRMDGFLSPRCLPSRRWGNDGGKWIAAVVYPHEDEGGMTGERWIPVSTVPALTKVGE